ncbi:RDD family protein [Yaniella halotolerans]|uniref:RDD family protein n=1 Tax=Yaniella halotolerans TaxID=225453 RepID=UPI0003B37B3D|nr:RDD family protein [Yaniella halotolerans]
MQDHTITGEAVVLNLRAANFMPRLGAALLDALVYLICWGFLVYGLAQFTSRFGLDVAATQAVMLLATILLVFIVPLLVEGCSHGRSLGKLAFGLRVVRDDGGTIRWRHAFTRCLAGVFELWMTFGSIAVLSSLFNKHSKRLGDMMAGSYVIISRAPRLPAPMPDVPPAMQQWAQVADVGRIPAGLASQTNSLIRNSATMHPSALATVSHDVYVRLLEYVTPGPPAGVDRMTFMVGVLAERRNRDAEVLGRQRDRRDRDAQYLLRQ